MYGWPESGLMLGLQPGLVQSISSGLSIVLQLANNVWKRCIYIDAGLAFRENKRVQVFFTCRSVCATHFNFAFLHK